LGTVKPLTLLFAAQVIGLIVLTGRLQRWRSRPPAVSPLPPDAERSEGPEVRARSVSILVPTYNEARRVGPLLRALPLQGPLVEEILVVDSGSTDGTRALVEGAVRQDSRIRLLTDPERPAGWIGKAWALEHGRTVARGAWLLGLDADTAPHPGLASAGVAAAERYGLDAASFAPRFAGQSAMERWLQPALLATLVYRVSPGAVVGGGSGDHVLANGQCFLVRREVLDRAGGFSPVRGSFAEDVSLARHLARAGARVGFLDGSRLYDVRSYASAGEMWREWGRSIDLKDATSRARQWRDILLLVLVQGLPGPLVALALLTPLGAAPVAVNAVLFAIRFALAAGLRRHYERRGAAYWLSPLADPAAVVRVIVSTLRRPTSWRGREYA
jgi:dolichol-phosphate mannosyltransferase